MQTNGPVVGRSSITHHLLRVAEWNKRALLLHITSVELSERDFRDIEKTRVELPGGNRIE